MTYVVRSADGSIVGSSKHPIDDKGGRWAAADRIWHWPVPGDGSYVEQVEDVPEAITPRQARLMLLRAGKLGQVTSAINSLSPSERQEAEIEWEYATQVERAHPLIKTLSSALGLSDAEMDQLFIQASKL